MSATNTRTYSMKRIPLYIVCAFICLDVSAIVVQDYVTAEAPPAGLNWDHVHHYKGSTAVAVAANWVLTAGHVADDALPSSIIIDGLIYTEQEIVYHPLADLALVRFDLPFPGHYTMYTGGVIGIPVLMVGYGNTGTVSSQYWTMGATGKGTKRWGSQIINSTSINYYDADGSVGFTQNYGYWMNFNLGNTSHEAGTAVGDSGSGCFYADGGVWKLAGLNTSVSASGGQNNATFSMSISYYNSWIVGVITSSPSEDADGDGLTNGDENALGTNPLNVDSDSDQITDYQEWNNGLNPLVSNVGVDSDSEGLLDVHEVVILGTDPLMSDTDGDGLTDAGEVNSYSTDPLRMDSDADNLNDGLEVFLYSTLPIQKDTDGDNTPDGDEVLIHGTDPTDPNSDYDLDDDEITDSWEIEHFTLISNCNPTNDPDGDYYSNLEEFENDTEPNTFDTFVKRWPAVKLEWYAETGEVYQVQMATNLLAGSWIDIGDPVVGDNKTHLFPVTTRECGNTWYRVVDSSTIIRTTTELEWNTAPGVMYQAQVSTNTGIVWTDLGTSVNGDGQVHYTFDIEGVPGDHKMYRIQFTPPPGP